MREFTLFSREDPSNYHGRPGDARRGGDGPSSPDSAFMKSGLCVQQNSPCELPPQGLVLAKAGSQMERGGRGRWVAPAILGAPVASTHRCTLSLSCKGDLSGGIPSACAGGKSGQAGGEGQLSQLLAEVLLPPPHCRRVLDQPLCKTAGRALYRTKAAKSWLQSHELQGPVFADQPQRVTRHYWVVQLPERTRASYCASPPCSGDS